MMSLPIWLPGPMFFPGGVLGIGILVEATEVGDTHPNGSFTYMLLLHAEDTCNNAQNTIKWNCYYPSLVFEVTLGSNLKLKLQF